MSSQSFRFSPEHPTAQNITLLNTSSSATRVTGPVFLTLMPLQNCSMYVTVREIF